MAEPHKHEWFEGDVFGTLKCRICGIYETELAEGKQAEPELCAECGKPEMHSRHHGSWTERPERHYFVLPVAESPYLKGHKNESI